MESVTKTNANADSWNGGPAREAAGPATELPGRPEPYFLDAGHGHRRTLLRQLTTTIIGTQESGGKFSIVMLEGPADDRPIPAHYHNQEDEFFYVLEGRLRVWVGDRTRVLYPGDSAFLPATVPHSFRMEGTYTKFMGLNSPGGFETFFDVVGVPTDLFMAPSELVTPTEEQWEQAAAEHDWHSVPDYDFGI